MVKFNRIILVIMLSLLYIAVHAQNLVNSNASQQTKALKAFLDDNFKNKIVSGQYGQNWCQWVKSQTGQTPAILGLDFMDYMPVRLQNGAKPTDTETALDWYTNKKGIVTFSWHWDAPTDIYNVSYRQQCVNVTGGDAMWYKAFYSCATYFDLNAALNSPGSAKYNLLISNIDLVAAQLKRLQDAGVPILWRPLHEAAGGWFWWGSQGPGPCKRLWALMYDRLVNYHKLNNLIWVWNSYAYEHGNALDWYPGDNMVDIISYDYPGNSSWSDYNSIFNGKNKLFGLAEVSSLPDPNNFSNQSWSYFVTWNEFIQNNNSLDYLKRVYNDPKVITLEKLPDLTNYLGVGKPGNLAYNKPVTVSSIEAGSNNSGDKAVDGRTSTRWSSVYSDPQWIQVDLGSAYQINHVYLNWEAAYAKAYRIDVSNDNTTWVTAYQTSTGDGGIDDITGLSSVGRYIRLYGTQRATQWGYSLYEFEVYGTAGNIPPVANAGNAITVTDTDNNGIEPVTLDGSKSYDTDGSITSYTWTIHSVVIGTGAQVSVDLPIGTDTIQLTVKDNNQASSTANVVVTVQPFQNSTSGASNIALHKNVMVSSTEANYGNIASLAVDGNTTTRWSSLYADPQWIQVDLSANYLISRVRLLWEAAYAKSYQIDVSMDGNTWNTIYHTTAGNGNINDITGLSAIGRYVRMYGTQRANQWGYSLYEFEVYGDAIPTLDFEAENATLNGVHVSTTTAGFSGTGYVDGFVNTSNNIIFPIQISSGGSYNLQIRYLTPYGEKKNFVLVNGNQIGEIDFPASSSWAVVEVPNIQLNSGKNLIQISDSWGWFYVDKISLISNQSNSLSGNSTGSSFTMNSYPNPVTGQLSVTLSPAATSIVDLQVLKLDGSLVIEQSFPLGTPLTVDLGGLSAGLYVLKITDGGNVKSSLIQKQ